MQIECVCTYSHFVFSFFGQMGVKDVLLFSISTRFFNIHVGMHHKMSVGQYIYVHENYFIVLLISIIKHK